MEGVGHLPVRCPTCHRPLPDGSHDWMSPIMRAYHDTADAWFRGGQRDERLAARMRVLLKLERHRLADPSAG